MKSLIVSKTGKFINPLNVTSEDVSVVDMVYALSYQPMNGGVGRIFYSKSEHLCNMYDYFVGRELEIIEKVLGKNAEAIMDMPNKEIKRYLFFYFGGHAYLTGVIGCFESWRHHNPRVIGSLLSSIGDDYASYKKVEPIFSYIDNVLRESIIETNYNKNNINFLNPYKAMNAFITRYNKYSPIPIIVIAHELFEHTNKINTTGQYELNWQLPNIRVH